MNDGGTGCKGDEYEDLHFYLCEDQNTLEKFMAYLNEVYTDSTAELLIKQFNTLVVTQKYDFGPVPQIDLEILAEIPG